MNQKTFFPEFDQSLELERFEERWKEIDYVVPVSSDSESFIYTLSRIKDDWLRRLELLSETHCTESKCIESITCFTKYLIEHQRFDDVEGMMIHGSWCLPEEASMPSYARVDFMYMPTYIAVAWLSLIKQDHQDIANKIPNLDHSLEKGLVFAAGRGLSGHGYDAISDMLIAIRYLSLGKVFTLVQENRDLHKKFVRALKSAVQDIKKNISSPKSWSSIIPEDGHIAMMVLEGTVDEAKFKRLIKGKEQWGS